MSRKPSVAASRRFSCSENLFLPSQHPTKHTADSYKSRRKVFWKGKDVTPDPLTNPETQIGFTIDEVGFLKEGLEDENTDLLDHHNSIDWINDFIDKTKNGKDELQHLYEKLLRQEINQNETKSNISKHQSANTTVAESKVLAMHPANNDETKRGHLPEIVNNNDPEFSIVLNETKTINILSLSGSSFANDDPSYLIVKDRNKTYDDKCKNVRQGNGMRTDCRYAQTYHLDKKSIGINTCEPTKCEAGCDWFEKSEIETYTDESLIEDLISTMASYEKCYVDASEGFSKKQNSENQNYKTNEDIEPKNITDIIQSRRKETILKSSNLAMKLLTIERMIKQTLNRKRQILYRGLLPAGKDINEECDSIQHIKRLFSFSCEYSVGRRVTATCWHRENTDILAVGYGKDTLKYNDGGFIMLWSLRNPSYPEKLIQTESPVTSLDFSFDRPSLIAAGLDDGRIVIYDTSHPTRRIESPLLDSSFIVGRHVQPVWQLKWVDNGAETSERLISISGDGRVLEWSTHKGLSLSILMILKHPHSKNISMSKCRGLCFDFSRDSGTTYLAGADKYLYRCSRSHNEQHLSSIEAHIGPITKIRYSPFVNNVFLTCSVDWTAKLWSTSTQEDMKNHFTFNCVNSKATINDICWSQRSSTIFALASSDGKLEVWDLSESAHDPVVLHDFSADNSVDSLELTSVLFSIQDDILVTGDSVGNITIFNSSKLTRETNASNSTEVQKNRLINLLSTRL